MIYTRPRQSDRWYQIARKTQGGVGSRPPSAHSTQGILRLSFYIHDKGCVIAMIVMPYKVNLNLEGISVPDQFRGTEKLALAYDSRQCHAQCVVGILRDTFQEQEGSSDTSGRVKCVKVCPYWVSDKREREKGVFAASFWEARSTEGFEEPWVRPCDPWYVLNGLSDTELARSVSPGLGIQE